MLKNCSCPLNLGLGLAVVLITGLNSPTFAQPTAGNEGYTSNEKDSLYGDAPAGLNPLDLMHRAQQLNGRSAAEFNQESGAQIDSSVSEFKRLQQQKILEQQQSQDTPAESSLEETE